MPKYNVRAPALPLPTPDYLQAQQDQFQNALRLYFNRLDAFLTELSGATGGAVLSFPYFSAYQNGNTALTGNITNVSTTPIPVTSTADFESAGFLIIESEIIQYTGKTATTFTGITRGVKSTTNVAHTTGTVVTEAAGVTAGSSAALKIDAVTLTNGITCTVPDSNVYFTDAGIYNIQFSAQLLNYANTDDNVYFWLRKNGADLPYTAGVEQVNPKHGSNPGATIVGWNYVEQFAAGDRFELYWTSGTGNTVVATYPAGTTPVHPVSPSLILTVTFVSAV
jgi:hypothetical protein